MRDRVKIVLGGKEYSLLPTMAVLDAFEDRYGSIGGHIQRLTAEQGLFTERAFLLWQGLMADKDNSQKVAGKAMEFTLEAVKKQMFEAGLYHETLMRAEVELIERLIYTPEQFAEKKRQREAAQEEQAKMLDALNNFSASQSLT